MEEDPATPTPHDDVEDIHEDQSEDGDDTALDEGVRGERNPSAGRSYTIEENTDYSLFANPPSLGSIRNKLFEIEDTIEMSIADFDQYFPFVDNVWRKCRQGEPQKENGAITDYYWCRLRKSTNSKPYVPKPTPEGKQSRKKRVREDLTCPMAIKVIRSEGVIRTCRIVRGVGPEIKHTHDMDYMDQIKRNSGVMDIARREAVKGFLPGSVYKKMLDEEQKLRDAGGKFMKISDVRNVQYAWRQEHPDLVLKAHAGYHQTRTGPRNKPSTPPVIHPQQPQSNPTTSMHQPTFAAHPPQPPAPSAVPAAAPSLPLTALAPMTQPPPLSQHPDPTAAFRGALQYPDHARDFLEAYLPKQADVATRTRPHITLTWATSLDSRIALIPGFQTPISGLETKAMTHYLRSRHDAIVVGVGTAIADDPSLNCRLAGAGGYGGTGWAHQPRPIIIDPRARLHIRPDMKVLQVVSEGRAKGPWVVVGPGAPLHQNAVSTLKAHGGEYLMINDVDPRTKRIDWNGIFTVLFKEGIKSIMIEGGAGVLSELLTPRYNNSIDSVIMTIAPAFFGRDGVEVSPATARDHTNRPFATRLTNVTWQPMGDADVVMCGRMRYEPPTNGMLPGIAEFSKGIPDHQRHNDRPDER